MWSVRSIITNCIRVFSFECRSGGARRFVREFIPSSFSALYWLLVNSGEPVVANVDSRIIDAEKREWPCSRQMRMSSRARSPGTSGFTLV
jgi:hypothetical protein